MSLAQLMLKLERYASWCLLLIVLISIGASFVIHAPCDDAYIFFVYVRNFLDGNGLTFNGEVVWGVTSLLWTLLLVIGGATGLELSLVGENLSRLSAVCAIVATYWFALQVGLSKRYALLATLMVAGTGDVIFYSGSGLEQVLCVALVASLAGLIEISLRQGGSAFLLPVTTAALVLCRPDSVIIVAALYAYWLLNAEDKKAPVIAAVLAMVCFFPVWLTAAYYFDSFLPNTFYAKSAPFFANAGEGFDYLLESMPRYGVLFLVAFGVTGTFLSRQHDRGNRYVAYQLVALVWLLYVGLNGGDNMVGGRLLIPVLPLLIVGLIGLLQQHRPRYYRLIIILTALSLLIGFHVDGRVQRHAEDWRAAYLERYDVGRYLRDRYPADTLVALNPAGIIPYISGMPTIDMLGLNNRYIAVHGRKDFSLRYAHQAGDGRYVLSRKPDIIYAKHFRYVSTREIHSSDVFKAGYSEQFTPLGNRFFQRNDIVLPLSEVVGE